MTEKNYSIVCDPEYMLNGLPSSLLRGMEIRWYLPLDFIVSHLLYFNLLSSLCYTSINNHMTTPDIKYVVR
jgi:hypothetical protein